MMGGQSPSSDTDRRRILPLLLRKVMQEKDDAGGARIEKDTGGGRRLRRRRSERVLSPCHPDVLRSFRRRSPADSPVGPSAPPGSHTAPPAKGEDSRGSRFMEGAKRGSRQIGRASCRERV